MTQTFVLQIESGDAISQHVLLDVIRGAQKLRDTSVESIDLTEVDFSVVSAEAPETGDD